MTEGTQQSRIDSDVARQRDYYAATADRYEALHQHDQEHVAGLAFLGGIVDWLDVGSVLDVGSGTGRVLTYLRRRRPDLRAVGVEPVSELREIGHRHGLPPDTLRDGDATRLAFGDKEFDLVSAFAVLHHIREPRLAVAEMLRVSAKAVFISDSNNYGQGSFASRTIKQLLRAVGLWKAAVWIKTGGKGHMISVEDGLSYPYSVFDNYRQIRSSCKQVHWMNTGDSGPNLYRTAGYVALLGVK